jgi:peptidyl-tRNA hydrolase, PTH1 family
MNQQAERVDRIVAVVGLGNPGLQYTATRHNVGFRVVERLAGSYSVRFEERKFPASWGASLVNGQKVVFFKPLTYMNRSGEAVSQMLRFFKISPRQMLVVHDDLDLNLGRIRLVLKGGTGGHRGVASLMEHLGGQDFARLKAGIGRPLRGETVEAYVLQPPYPEQERAFEEMIERGTEAVRTVLTAGTVRAMNLFNRNDSGTEAVQ